MGPVAAIVLPMTFPEQIDLLMADVVAKIGESPDDALNHQAFDLWINDSTAIAGVYQGDKGGRPFMIDKDAGQDCTLEANEVSAIQDSFGIEPALRVAVSANCNDDVDHMLLAEVCAYIAESLGGIIDFGGALVPPLRASGVLEFSTEDCAKFEPAFEEMIRSMPGQIVSVPNQTRTWVSHFADPEFLRAWMRHKNFRMVK